MVSIGRLFCVSFPFVLTFVAFLALLVATLGGGRVHGVYLFEINLTNLTIDPHSLSGLLANSNLTSALSDLQGDASAQSAPKKVTVHGKKPADQSNTAKGPAAPEDNFDTAASAKAPAPAPAAPAAPANKPSGHVTVKQPNNGQAKGPAAPQAAGSHAGSTDNVASTQSITNNKPANGHVSVKQPVGPRDLEGHVISSSIGGGGSSKNVTAADLGLDNIYQINIWGTCSGRFENQTSCTAPKWDWATSRLNDTFLSDLGAAAGVNVTLPSQIHDGLKAFATSIKWLQIVLTIALGLLGLEIIFGAFSSCSRLWSCLAYIVAGIATTVTIVAAVFSTVIIVLVVGAMKASSELYGFDASLNRPFLGLIWFSVACSILSGVFWCFSVCCCAPDKRRSRRGGSGAMAAEKDYGAGSYQPLSSPKHGDAEAGSSTHTSQVPYQTGAYEPYSHRV